MPKEGKAGDFKINLNVLQIEHQSGISVSDFYNNDIVKKNLRSSWLEKCEKVYKKEERYDNSKQIVLNINSQMINFEAIQNKSIIKRDNKAEVFSAKGGGSTKSPWVCLDKDKKTEKIKANNSYIIQQWKEGEYLESNPTMETILLDLDIYEDLLQIFGIKDVSKWKCIAPNIFENLDFRCIGIIDINNTTTNYGGINSKEKIDPIYDFALSVKASWLIADIPGVYKSIGIPVSEVWIKQYYKIENNHSNNTTFIPTIVCLDDDEKFQKFIIGSPNVEYRVVLPIRLNNKITEKLRNLSIEEGDELMRWLMINQDPTEEEKKFPPNNIIYTTLLTVLQIDNNDFYVFAIQNNSKTMGALNKETRIKKILGIYEDVKLIEQVQDIKSDASINKEKNTTEKKKEENEKNITEKKKEENEKNITEKKKEENEKNTKLNKRLKLEELKSTKSIIKSKGKRI